MRLATLLLVMAAALVPASPVMPAPQARFVRGACPGKPSALAGIKGARCGYLTVPENRSKPDGKLIRLPVAIIPAVAAKPARDPILWLTGGPGFDAYTQAQYVLDWGLNRDRNVILMSQRGTYSSQPSLVCPNLDRFNARSVGLRYDAASTEKLHAQAVAACYRSLRARGIDLSAYNTTASAADYDDLRTALGIPRWNVWGMSYGSDLALTYVRLYPKSVRAFGIDGVVPPDIAGAAMTWPSLHEGLYNVFHACAAQPACHKRYPKLAATFIHLVRRLEAHPITTTVTLPERTQPVKVVIDGGVLVNWAVPATHNPTSLPQLIHELAQGHPRAIAQQWAARQIGDPQQYGIYAYGLAYSIFCSEWIPYEPAGAVLAAGRRAFPTFPDSVLAQGPQLAYMRTDCREWPVAKAPSSIRDATRNAIPALVMSATFDAQSGAQWGRHAARTLSRATVVEIPGVAHMAIAASPCAQTVITSFFDHPLAPNLACVRAIKPRPFKTGPSIR